MSDRYRYRSLVDKLLGYLDLLRIIEIGKDISVGVNVIITIELKYASDLRIRYELLVRCGKLNNRVRAVRDSVRQTFIARLICSFLKPSQNSPIARKIVSSIRIRLVSTVFVGVGYVDTNSV